MTNQSPTADQVKQIRSLHQMMKGLTKYDAIDFIGSMIGVSRYAWYRYENGVTKMNPALWQLINIKTYIDLPDEINGVQLTDRVAQFK